MKRIVSINADDLKLKDQSVFILFNELVGTVKIFAGDVIPEGYLLCDGSEISRTSYEDLFNAIGTIYGKGDGSTTFNLPNLIGKFIEGSDNVGNVKSAGLPNIEGHISWSDDTGVLEAFRNLDGAFIGQYQNINSVARASTSLGPHKDTLYGGALFKASNSNAIYGNSTTVQPPSVTMHYIIKY